MIFSRSTSFATIAAVGLWLGFCAGSPAAEKTPAGKKSAAGQASLAPAPAGARLDTALISAQLETLGALPTMTVPKPLDVKPDDWPMWGGTTARNNVAQGKNIPIEWEVGGFDSKSGAWLKDKSRNIKWCANLGSQSYGNPVVANGRVYVGTNNGAAYLKRYPESVDLGVLLCFNEADGKFLWQHSNEKLITGRVHDWPFMGVCSTSYAEGDRVWYVSNRGEVVCLDAQGFYDGVDDGPVVRQPAKMFEIMKNEDPAKDKFAPAVDGLKAGQLTPDVRGLFAAAGLALPDDVTLEISAPATAARWRAADVALPDEVTLAAEKTSFKFSFQPKDGKHARDVSLRIEGPKLVGYKILNPDDTGEADVIWSVNMMTELGISQHNMCDCSVIAVGNLLFVNTSNGVDEGHINLPAPHAPSFVCMDKNTGKVIWTDNSPGVNVLHGQWSSPTYAVIDGVPQVLFGGGDGWLYSFVGDGSNDAGHPKRLWEFDCNPKESKYVLGGRANRNHIIGTPVIYQGLVYVGVGEDPEHGEGIGHLWCIDPRRRGDVSSELALNRKDLTKPLPHRRNQAVIKEQGDVARPNPNSAAVWHLSTFDANNDNKIEFEETFHRTCGTVAIKDDLCFVADFSGLVFCVNALTGEPYWTHDMLAACWGSPLIVDDKVYIGDEDGDITIFKLSKEKELIAEHNMGSAVFSTPVVANGTLFIADKDHVFAIENSSTAARATTSRVVEAGR